MASSELQKDGDMLGMHSEGQDSAVHLHDSPLQHSHALAPLPPAFDDDTVTAEEEPPHAYDTEDSGFDSGSLLGDETDTLASSILNHRIENGRQYHAYRDGSYWGPNDELAKEILDFAHHMYLLTLDQKLHLAPIQNPQNVLDVGTGTGIWAIVRNFASLCQLL